MDESDLKDERTKEILENNNSNDDNVNELKRNTDNPLPQLFDTFDIIGEKKNINDDNVEPVLIEKTIEDEYNEILSQADNNFKSYQYSKAAPLYNAAIEKAKDNIMLSLEVNIYLYDQLSICYEKQNKCKESVDCSYVILSQYNQKHISSYQRIVSILLSLNEIDKVKKLIDYIRKLFNTDTKALEQFNVLINQIDKKEEENKLLALTKLNKEKQKKWFHFFRYPLIKFSIHVTVLLLGSFVLAKYTYHKA